MVSDVSRSICPLFSIFRFRRYWNALEIRVTNLWVNRLIGDAQPGVTERITYTTRSFYQTDDPPGRNKFHPSFK